jgi:hypothetical protein
MKKLIFAVPILAFTGFLSVASSAVAETKYIDPEILKQLQAIEPIDRSKLKSPLAYERITAAFKGMSEAKASYGMTEKFAPGVNIPNKEAVMISGKTKRPISIGGTKYPSGLDSRVVFDTEGNIIQSSVDLPPLYPEAKLVDETIKAK